MVFSSQSFLFYFVPIVLLAYALVPRRGRNALLLVASLTFYTWGGGDFVLILIASIAGNWLLGRAGGRAFRAGDDSARRFYITFSVLLNLGILGWFKYANFFVDQINSVAGFATGQPAVVGWMEVALPIGISFFTFQAMSYVIDVSSGRAEPVESPTDFALYVALFPQLIAGPIVRYREIADQLRERSFDLDGVTRGALRFTHGLIKKVVVADTVAVLTHAAFSMGGDMSMADAWLGVFAFSVQLYFDFSGYADMAIGLGMMFGFRFPENFIRPYSSVSVTDFWRRWHLTLSAWFRDYVFISLGGSRGTPFQTYRNLFTIFFLVGLWHGAAWTYVIFGAYHGGVMVIERITNTGEVTSTDKRVRAARRVLAWLLISLSWPIFNAESIGHAWAYYGCMLDFSRVAFSPEIRDAFTTQGIVMLVLGSVQYFLPGRGCIGIYITEAESRPADLLRYATAVLALPVALVVVISGSFSPFLYFQF
jgi:alginate O-acetyltransferase complex protein AlgI